MTRFEEVTRLRELEKKAMHAPWTIKTPEHNDGYQETWIVGPGETGVMPIFDDEDDHLNVAMRNAAPWLLEVAGCVQRGDATLLRKLHYLLDTYHPDNDEDMELIERLLEAAKIMEEKE